MAVKQNLTLEQVRALAMRLEQLRLAYERYFAGVDKLEPTGERQRFRVELDKLDRQPSPNTQARFQLTEARNRFVLLQGHWNRVLREIEEGRYTRDRFRLAQRPVSARTPETASATAEPGARGAEVDELYEAYLEARRRCNEAVDGISKDRLAASLERQRSRARERDPAVAIDFRVVIREGRAQIVARPRKG